MKKLIFTFAVFLLPIAGHGIVAILGNEDARFFLHWSMLIATLIGSGLGLLIVKVLPCCERNTIFAKICCFLRL